MDSAADDATVHFVAKWHQREPEMQFAELFCPGDQKMRFRAWGALLHELRETLFELSDPRVSVVKTGWWAEELIGLDEGKQRHPITAALIGLDAPWSALGRALLDHDVGDRRAADTAQAVELLLPTASAMIAVESAIFGAGGSADAPRSLAVHWLLQRLPRGLASDDQARLPMHLLARHGLTAGQLPGAAAEPMLRDWGRELALATPGDVRGASLFRRSRHRFDQAAAERLAAGKGPGGPAPLLTFWRAWRSARGR